MLLEDEEVLRWSCLRLFEHITQTSIFEPFSNVQNSQVHNPRAATVATSAALAFRGADDDEDDERVEGVDGIGGMGSKEAAVADRENEQDDEEGE